MKTRLTELLSYEAPVWFNLIEKKGTLFALKRQPRSRLPRAPHRGLLPRRGYADGGTVPINAAGGEYVIPPETVAAIGKGDLSHGHDILDKWVSETRNRIIGEMRRLPEPVR